MRTVIGGLALAIAMTASAADKVKVGFISTLSGPNASIGSDIRDGFNLAIKHAGNKLGKETSLTETGAVINGRGDTPNLHDILTGSTPDGRAAPQTCNDWTSSGDGAAIVGHHDRTGLDESVAAKSWNSSHPTRGCGQEALKATGGAGLLYCFATN